MEHRAESMGQRVWGRGHGADGNGLLECVLKAGDLSTKAIQIGQEST